MPDEQQSISGTVVKIQKREFLHRTTESDEEALEEELKD
jgi:hypothetical protein